MSVDGDAPPAAAAMSIRERITSPSVGAIAIVGVVVYGVAAGLLPLDDNSFLTHLATGRLIVDDWSIPTHDPYSWSAPGEPWVVQSWLASLLYGLTEEAGGATLLRLLFGLEVTALGLITWRLSHRASGLLPRIAITGMVLLIGKAGWSERPLLIGLLCLGVALLAVEGDVRPGWLIPVGWVWVNSHGSFPLGVALLGALALGSWLDGERPPHELRPAAFLLGGMLLGAVNPLGPVLLLFPIELLGKMDVLRNVIEWRAPGFTDLWQRIWLLEMVVAWLGLVRRPSWRSGLAVAVASAISLLALRNIVVASLFLVPILATLWGDLGQLSAADRPRLARVGVGVVGGLAVLIAVVRLDDPDYRLTRYPTRAVAWLRAEGIAAGEGRVVTHDYAGNYLESVEGDDGKVFYDDRFDMFPTDVSADYYDLVTASPRALSVLDRREADTVIWRREDPLAATLSLADTWRVVYVDDLYVVACRRSAPGEGCVNGL
jgi:hypothetical protein